MNIVGVQVEDGTAVLSASAAQTATFTTAKQDGFKNCDSWVFQVNVTAISGTGATLDGKLQDSFDSGTTWQDVPNGAITQIVLAGGAIIQSVRSSSTPLCSMVRAVFTIAGTTPSITFSASLYAKAKKTIGAS